MSLFLNQQSNAATNKASLISTKCQKTRNRGIRRILPKPRKPGNWPISGKCTNRGLSRILGSRTPEFASPGRGPQNCPPGPRNCPVWGGYPPELAWSKGKYAVFCCFLLNSTEFREFPVGGPQKRVFRYPGSKGKFGVSRTPKSAQTGPNRPQTPNSWVPGPPNPQFWSPAGEGQFLPFWQLPGVAGN